jgi:hypothetical protein
MIQFLSNYWWMIVLLVIAGGAEGNHGIRRKDD